MIGFLLDSAYLSFYDLNAFNDLNDLNDFSNGQLTTDNGLNDSRTPVAMVKEL
ncbi:MAG: hypothetical protein JRD00_05760 [Deltaproteobacteria bacterium]|nr:hypothetical protein [Deltaproteobacteria bacterium]